MKLKKLALITLCLVFFSAKHLNATDTGTQTTQQTLTMREEVLDTLKKLDMQIAQAPEQEEQIMDISRTRTVQKLFPTDKNKQKIFIEVLNKNVTTQVPPFSNFKLKN